jgi:thiosulfate reductase/polysulfide reductase chain A
MNKPVEVKEGICYMCTSACPIKVHVRNGRVVKIDIADPAVAHCPRWKAQLDFVYRPDRLQYPVKRQGKRRDGSWQRISWDEALDTVAEKLCPTKLYLKP